jgi:hypothetical protein
MLLTAGFDCSQDSAQKYFIMAGFVSSSDRWREFDAEWRKRLAKDNLPYFHMWAFAGLPKYSRKPFDKSWLGNENRRRDLLGDLLEIIKNHAWRKVACILPLDVTTRLSEEARIIYAPAPIALAVRLVWSDLEGWRQRERFCNPARLVFEQGDKNRGALTSAAEKVSGGVPGLEYKQDNPERSIVAFTPLQASDMLAYEIQKMTASQGKNMDGATFRFPYKQLETIPGDIRMLQLGGANLIDEWARVVGFFDNNPLGSNSP